MKKTMIILRWISLPIVIVLIISIIAAGFNFLSKIFNPMARSGFIMLIASAFACYFAVKIGLDYSPVKNKFVLFGICAFILFIAGLLFAYSVFVMVDYLYIWAVVGQVIGTCVCFWLTDENDFENK